VGDRNKRNSTVGFVQEPVIIGKSTAMEDLAASPEVAEKSDQNISYFIRRAEAMNFR
jgi:hypothetical protein